MGSRFARVKSFLAPPVFPDDEDKTLAAKVLNALLLNYTGLLLFTGLVIVPLVFSEKLYNSLFTLVFLVLVIFSRWLMYGGRVRLASRLLLTSMWLLFTFILLISGGITSPVVLFYVCGTVLAGLILGMRAALLHALACIIAGFGMLLLEYNSFLPPQIFPMPSLSGWIDLLIVLYLTVILLNIVLSNLKDALKLARRQMQERKKVEDALHMSEEQYEDIFQTVNDGLAYTTLGGKVLAANKALENILGISHEDIVGKSVIHLSHHLLTLEMAQMAVPKLLSIIQGQNIEPFQIQYQDQTLEISAYYNRESRRIIGVIRDITAHVHAQEALQESEEKYRLLVENQTDLLVKVDTTGRFQFVSQSYCTLFAKTETKLLGSQFMPLVYKDDREILSEAMPDLYRPPFKTYVEQRAMTKDGWRWLGWMNTSLLDETGQVTAIISVGRDITERKKVENELAVSQKMLREVLDTIPVRVFWKDRNSVYMGCNQLFAEDAGKASPDDLIGELDYQLFPEQAELFRSDDRRVMESGQPKINYQEPQTHLSGKQTWLNTSKVPLRDSQGQVYGVLGTYEDITERKQIQEEREILLAQVQAQVKRIQQTMDTVPEGMILLDDQGCAILVNPMGERDLALLAGAQVGDTITYLGDLPLADILSAKGQNPWYQVTTEDRFFEVIARSLDGAQTTREWLLVIRDVTRERHTQQLAQRRDRLAAVGQLAAGIAHDFNNILTAIQGYSELVLSELDPDALIYEDMGQVKQAAQRAAELISQLLAFSRKQIVQPQILNLNDLVTKMEGMLQRLIGEDIDLIAVPSQDLGRVNVDPGQFEQVLMNLAVNARDAIKAKSASGGKLTVETANVILDPEYTQQHPDVTPGPYVLLAVSDNGIGMDQETQAHIFEPFFTTKEQGKGTGLGLASIYGIVRQSGSHIWVYSEPGVGTTFKIYIPRIQSLDSTPEDIQNSNSPLVPRGTETILLVEDEEMVRKLASRVLRHYGYTVLDAGHPGQALLLNQTHEDAIHLLITDIVMPDMHGHVLAEQVVSARPNIKVLYISGYTDKAIIHRNVLDKSVSFLQKPFAPDVLIRMVRELLDKS